ncbi:phospholipid-translocating P-type ATPase [Cristinia sonorae]|uniref:Phospholipid-transporting ATPase n=1 Tax=Cristinia sonorae TaxID=1940300 RepID=A0A8K0XNW4_9AGAR|nr:phospholipid-translocating P-type ATPase [Cristinia sonorae]
MAPKQSWYRTLADFKVESLFSRKRPVGPPRSVFVRQSLPADYYDHKQRIKKEHVFSTNQVITSKYTIITFLPRNLLEQFRRIANVFFLAIAILQFFPQFSTVSPGLVILPLIVVLTITALKDGYEDIKRHQADRAVNYSVTRVLAGEEWENPNPMEGKSKTFVKGFIPQFKRRKGATKKSKGRANAGEVEALQRGAPPEGIPTDPHLEDHEGVEFDDHEPAEASHQHQHHGLLHRHHSRTQPHWRLTTWEDVRVGDFVKIMNNESLPADIMICATSEDENVAFVETKNLDGETNLKSRSAVPQLTNLRTAAACADKGNVFRVDCDRPDTNLYKLNAALALSDEQKFPVDIQQILLRGTVIRNTDWVIGLVLYTGEDTKIVMNSGNTPSKRSKVERQMNPQVFINLILLAAMAIVCGIVDSVLEQHNFPLNAPWEYGATHGDDNPRINGLITWANALITFQNIVPISLYISIEGVRTVQALFIYFDREMYYEKTDSPTLARSWNLSDDLGQIEYIFSDKTGTLTQNAMAFRECSIGGKIYRGDSEDEDEEATKTDGANDNVIKVSPDLGSASSTRPSSNDNPKVSSLDRLAVADPKEAQLVKLSDGVLQHFRDAQLKADIEDAAGENASNSSHARSLNGFWLTLALCHTALTSVDPQTGAIEYRAQSPDEAALVQAAADVGFVFRGRDRDILSLSTPFSDEIEQYELLNVLEFNSTRKRMSVVIRRVGNEDRRILMLTKGADNVIFERLISGAEELKKSTEEHLAEFASNGLRTLTLAFRMVPDDEYHEWSRRYSEASIALDNREERLMEISAQLEHDLRLLGATAIEDRLQDGVPETIADLKLAGIKIWVATGDKLETAIAIGHSTNLIGREDNIIIVRGGDGTSRPVYSQMLGAVEEFFPESGILGDERVHDHMQTASNPHGQYPLQRVNTGVTDIVGRDNGNRPGGFVLVIDGSALDFALSDEHHKHLLLRLATQCEAVICCRVSPLQKALIVKLVKDGLGRMTLAIGDGANDVSMIQAADVGVGISGEEGLQAVNSSDYAIAQFRFLKRLLLVHGHWSYSRNGNMIVNFFYKNIVCIGILWWYQIYCAWSSQYVFEYTYVLFWNSFWTIAPVVVMGLFDRTVDDHVLMALPELYAHARKGEYFGVRLFLVYMLDGIYQSAIIFFLLVYTYFTTTSRTDGYNGYIYEFSTTMIIAAVVTVTLFNGINISTWTRWVFWALGVELVLIWIYTAVYSAISPGWFSTPVFGNNHYLFPSAYFWLGIFLVVPIALLPRISAKAYKFIFFPSDIDRVRYIHKRDPNRDFARDKQNGGLKNLTRSPSSLRRARQSFLGSRTDMSTGMRSVSHGFDFDMEENGVALRRLQSNLSERRATSPTKRRKMNASSLVPHLSLPRSMRRKKSGQPPLGGEDVAEPSSPPATGSPRPSSQ